MGPTVATEHMILRRTASNYHPKIEELVMCAMWTFLTSVTLSPLIFLIFTSLPFFHHKPTFFKVSFKADPF